MTDSEQARPLIITADDSLLDGLLRLSAAAGVTPEVAADVTLARRSWATASCVIIGIDRLDTLVGAVDRRDRVVVVAQQPPSDVGRWADAVAVGAEAVHVLPDADTAVVELLSASIDGSDQQAPVLGVIGGSGGCGASTLAAGVAIAAARRRHSTLLVDADPLGGGIDILIGNEDANGLRWPDLAATQGRVSGTSLRQVLPRASELSVLSWDRGELEAIPGESMHSVIAAGRRSHDLVIIDLPRHIDSAGEEALGRTTTVLLVASAQVRAIAAAQRVLTRIRPLCADIQLVVRAGPKSLRPDVVADTLGLPLTTTVRTDRRLAELVDDGLGPLARRRTPLTADCSKILDHNVAMKAVA